jgi:hypothetical protein
MIKDYSTSTLVTVYNLPRGHKNQFDDYEVIIKVIA